MKRRRTSNIERRTSNCGGGDQGWGRAGAFFAKFSKVDHCAKVDHPCLEGPVSGRGGENDQISNRQRQSSNGTDGIASIAKTHETRFCLYYCDIFCLIGGERGAGRYFLFN